MTLMDQTQGSEMERLWALLAELSAQLSQNRQQTEELHRRAEELKVRATDAQLSAGLAWAKSADSELPGAHRHKLYTPRRATPSDASTSTSARVRPDFPFSRPLLRLITVVVFAEEFDSELEKLNVQLVMENQALQQENRQLSSLLKDYESTLEAVMGKFRAHAVRSKVSSSSEAAGRLTIQSHLQYATQQHHLELIRHYESLLLNMPVTIPPPPEAPQDPSNPETAPIDPLHLQLSLSHLASLIRKALRALQGEDPEDSTSPLLQPMGIGEAAAALSGALAGGMSEGDGSARSEDGGVGDNHGPPSPTSSIASFSSVASSAARATPSSYGSEPDIDRLLASAHPSTARSRQLEHEGGYISRRATTDPLYVPTTSTSSLVASPPQPGQPTVLRDEFEARGLGPLDEALQRDIELEALRKENDELKKLLGISSAEVVAEEAKDRAKEEERRKEREKRADEIKRLLSDPPPPLGEEEQGLKI